MDDIISQTKHKSGVVTIYEKGFSRNEVDSLIALIKDLGQPEIKVSGIALTVVAELMPEGTGALFNLILAEESDIEVVRIPVYQAGKRRRQQS